MTRQEKTAAAVFAAMLALLILIRITGPDDTQPPPTGQPPTPAHVNWSGMTWPSTTTTSTTTTSVAPSAPVAVAPPPPPPAQEPVYSEPVSQTASASDCVAPGPTPPEYVKQRESGGDYGLNDPNGHYGAWQFAPTTWRGVGGVGNPADASPAEQDCRAAVLWNNGKGASHWAATL